MVNFSYALLQPFRALHPEYSILDLKSHYRGPRYASETIKMLQGFGIVAKIGEDLSDIGSFVKVASVLKKYENGELDIVVEGINRFTISSIDVHPNGYFIPNVSEYNDNSHGSDPQLLDDIRTKFEVILKKVSLRIDSSFWRNFDSAVSKSFKIAEKSGLSLPEQQKLLSMQDENERLYYLRNHFERLEEQISERVTEKMIILNDGYIN